MSPTISSSRSSSVTIPSIAPYSSTTTAMCCFSRRKSARSAARSFVSGTTYAGRTIASSSTFAIPRSWIAPKRSRTWRIADDLVERVAVDRVARVGRVDDRARAPPRAASSTEIATTSGRGTITAEDLLRGEVEDLVEHLLLGLLELADVLRRRDRVPDVLARVRDHPGRRRLDPEQAQHEVRGTCRSQTSGCATRARNVERDGEAIGEPLRLLQRDRLRHELAEHDARGT